MKACKEESVLCSPILSLTDGRHDSIFIDGLEAIDRTEASNKGQPQSRNSSHLIGISQGP